MKEVTLDDFIENLKSQGVSTEKITFRCPRCNTVQCGQDFINAGAGNTFDDVEKYVAFSCIGRWDKDKGCDWTLGGLFQIHKLEVITPDGKRHPRFMPTKDWRE